jgi:hypothetical protein
MMICCVAFVSCEYENAEIDNGKQRLTWGKDIMPLMIMRCAIPGCHTGSSATGDFNRYEDVRTRIVSGKFRLMVFENKLMPPAAYPRLSANELSVFQGWIDSGFPE